MVYPIGVTSPVHLRELRLSRSLYPNPSTLAYFLPNSLTLYFDRLSRNEYAAVVAEGATGANRRPMEIVAHELTHWSDQVSSVWGQDYMVRVFDAYEAARSNQEETLFKLVELFDEERRILLPLYYHVVTPNSRPHDVHMPWQIEFSAGHEFSPDGRVDEAHPIFFVTFSDNELGTRVARQPITVGALIETTATWSELLAGLSALASLSGAERTVEEALWKRERLRPLYDPALTQYTAPAHMLARFSGNGDLLLAYERGAAVANVALNLTEPLFDRLQHPDSFAPFGSRRAAFVRARNRGYAFAVLARHAAEADDTLPIKDWIADVLTRSGLPAYDAILQTAYAHLETLSRGLPVRSDLDRVRDYLLEVGRDRFVQRASAAFGGKFFDALGRTDRPMPPMFDCNGDLFCVGTQPLNLARFDPEAMHSAEMHLRGFTRNFLLGCRGFDPS